jgi:EAL domain-containing protein (putative c-di-GMP-specific phosphodiesterase class I)/ActR/RegA family two-component response regulator
MSESNIAFTRAVASRGLVLLVDDDIQVLSAYGRILRAAGMEVVQVSDGTRIEEVLATSSFDAVISDIRLQGASGIGVLRAVRAFDPDLPVVLITAGGDLTSAVDAVTHGALRYLLKPIPPGVLSETVLDAVRLRRLALTKRRAFELYGSAAVKETLSGDLTTRFERALETLWMAYQPIVRWSDRSVFAHEALVRNEEPTLRAPDALLAASETLGRLFDVGRAVRRSVAETLETTSADRVFVNLHPRDLEDQELFGTGAPLTPFASKVVLEITERASLSHVADLKVRLASLRKLGYRLAIDDLGAGYAGLTSFAELEPEVVKLDMALTRSIDREPTKQKLVGSMTRLCGDLDILVVGEGVETAAERDTLAALGCDLLQGYQFAKPGPAFPRPNLS